jgi:hypothetical protein
MPDILHNEWVRRLLWLALLGAAAYVFSHASNDLISKVKRPA